MGKERLVKVLKAAGCFKEEPTIDVVIEAHSKIQVGAFCERVERPLGMDSGEYMRKVIAAAAAKLKAIEESVEAAAAACMNRAISRRMQRGEIEGVSLSESLDAANEYIRDNTGPAVSEALNACIVGIETSSEEGDGALHPYTKLKAAMDEHGVFCSDIANLLGLKSSSTVKKRIDGKGKRFTAVEMALIHFTFFRDVGINPMELFEIDWCGDEWHEMRESAEREMNAIDYLTGGYFNAILAAPKQANNAFRAWVNSKGYDQQRFREHMQDDIGGLYKDFFLFCNCGRSISRKWGEDNYRAKMKQREEPSSATMKQREGIDCFLDNARKWFGLTREECEAASGRYKAHQTRYSLR